MIDREQATCICSESSQSLIVKSGPENIYQTFAFPSICEISRMAYKPQLPNVSLALIFLWYSHMYIHNKFGYFFLLIYLMLIWLLPQPEEHRKVWRKNILHPNNTKENWVILKWSKPTP